MKALLLKAAPYLIAASALLGLKYQYDAGKRREGALGEQLKQATAALTAANQRAPRVDSVFRVDTVRLTRRLTTTQTLLDTLRLSDTVTLTRRESVLVFVADSLVQQCRATVLSCIEVQQNLRERLRLTEIQRDAWKQSRPSVFGKARTAIGWAAVGFLIGVTR
jgi:hypothetical protein